MRSAVVEANAINEDIVARLRAGDTPPRRSYEWWESATARWKDATVDLNEHVATHTIRSDPSVSTQN